MVTTVSSSTRKKRTLGARSAAKSRDNLNRKDVDTDITRFGKSSFTMDVENAIHAYLSSPGIEHFRNSTLVPSLCCPYDLYIVSRISVDAPALHSSLSLPIDYYVVLSQLNDREQISIEFESFLASLPPFFSDIHVSSLLQLLAFLSFASSDVVKILKAKNLLSNLVGCVLNMLTDKKSTTKLAPAIAILAHIVEHEDSSCNDILNDANISQLLKLCLTRALYPTLGEDENGLRNEMEICSCRIALKRLLEIPFVQKSPATKKEVESFIRKWWQRLRISSLTPGVSGSFEHPDSCSPEKVPILRTALELAVDILIAPTKTSVFQDLLCDESTGDLHFLSSYIQSVDLKTSMAAIALVKELNLSNPTSITVKKYVECPDLYQKVRYILCES